MLHRLVYTVQADVLDGVEDLKVFFDLVRTQNALVEAVKGRPCRFDRSIVPCCQDELANALNSMLLRYELLPDLEVRVVFLDLLGAPPIPHRPALHHLIQPLILCMLDEELEA